MVVRRSALMSVVEQRAPVSRTGTKMAILKLIFLALNLAVFSAPALGCFIQQEQTQPKEIAPDSYWYNYALDRVISSSEKDGYIVGTIQARHALSRFRVRKDLAVKLEAKTRGYKLAVDELVSGWLSTSAREFALTKLRAFTQENFEQTSDWEKWYRANNAYLVWSERRGKLIVDEEAKRAGVPTEEFRKKKPWPQLP